jgi:serine/threonine protein phosphatase PrpC
MEALKEIHPTLPGLSLVERVRASLVDINIELRETAAAIGPNALIGSTVVVVLIRENQSCCLWAGDSRFYRMRAGQLTQLSRDQSHVQDLVDRGEIAPEAAATHPLGNIVTNLVGASDELILEERRDSLEPEDILLLCTDGLNRVVTDTEIAGILGGGPAAAAADRLIERALARGARDNVSAVVIKYRE